jgi:DNA-binding transcriptional ArsR family regulator
MKTASIDEADTATVARLLADRTRATMLWALSDGRALPAGELARAAQITPATASAHLARLVNAGFVRAERVGRQRHFRLARPELIRVLETLATLAPPRVEQPAAVIRPSGLRLARTCYDHLAGRAGVHVTDALLAEHRLAETEAGYEVEATAERWWGMLGIDVGQLRRHARSTRRAFARACLDWSERRPHVAGALGAALCARLLELAWFERLPATRSLRVTPEGRRALRQKFGVVLF